MPTFVRRWAAWLATVAASLSPLAASAASEPHQHIVDLWQQSAGLPQNYVYTILQTRDGYLWVGTRSGIARFDGVRFVTIDDRVAGQLKESEVWALAEDSESALWIGTYGGGLTRYKAGTFSTFGTSDGLPSNKIRTLATSRDGSLWVGTENGLAQLKNGRFVSVARRLVPGRVVTALHNDEDDVLWIGTDAGLVSHRDGMFVNHTATYPDRLTGVVSAIAGDATRGVWVGVEPNADHEGGLRLLQHGSVTSFTARDGLASDYVMSIVVDKNVVWAGTRQGLCRSSGAGFEQYRSDVWGFAGLKVLDRVAQQGVPALAVDNEGSIWFGTQLDGLGRLRRTPLLYESGGAPAEVGVDVRTLLEDPHGTVWMGTAHDVRQLRDGAPTIYQTIPSGSPADAIAIGSDGVLLVGSSSGLYRLQGGRLVRSPIFTGAMPNVSVLFTDSRGRLWVGTRADGIYESDSGRLTHLTSREGLLGDQVRAIAEDHQGGIWIGTREGGVSRWKDGAFTTFGPSQGLPGADVQALAVDRDDVVWLSTRQGLTRIKDGKAVPIAAERGLPANYFYQVLPDGEHLWMSCARGIARVPLAGLNAVADGHAGTTPVEMFGAESGLAHTTVTLVHQPTVMRRRDGTVWFATTRGAAIVDYAALPRNATVPPVHIEEVAVNREFLSGPPDGLTLRPDQREVAIYYTAPSFVVPGQVQFKRKLEGFDPDWIDTTTRRAIYTNLPSGRYRFRVIAANDDGVWNEAGDSFAFEVLPRWYERRWVWPLTALCVALAALWAHRRRLTRLEARERELSARVAERTNELAQLMAELEDRINERTSELASANTELVSQKERLAVTLRSIGDGVIATDVEGRVMLLNRVAETLTGWTSADASGQPVERVFRTIDRYTREPLLDPTHSVLNDGAAVANDFPVLLVGRDGHERLVADSAAPIRDPQSRIIGAVFVFRDITERERLEDQVRNTQKLEALGVLAGGIAHDFNNLLTGIFGFIEAARDEAADPDRVRNHTDRAVAVFDKARALTRQLLTFSKAGEPVRDVGQLGPIVREGVRFVLSGSNVAADVDIPTDLWPCEVDAAQIAQVVDNLILNARQAMPGGGIVTIRLSNEERGEARRGPWVRLSVEDQGPGIPRALWPRVYDPFFTTKPGGTGLGLSVVHSIVRRHGGTVELGTGAGGQGARIDVLLPAVPGAVPTAPVAPNTADGAVGVPRRARILVMDDEEYVQRVARSALGRLGHEALLAKDDREAAALLERSVAEGRRVDAAILDITIPGGLGGVDALAKLRAIAPDLPAIVSTGYSADAILAHPERHGFDGALPKPFLLVDLRTVLNRVLTKGR